MKRRTVALLFAAGCCIGLPFAGLYIRYSPSQDRYFHAFVIAAGCCVSFPAVVIFLRITLQMWDMAQEQRGILKELKDEIKPLAVDGREAILDIKEVVRRIKETELGKVSRELDKLAQDGTVERALRAVESLPAKVDALLRRAEKRGMDDLIDRI